MSYYSNALSDEELASLRDYLDEVREKTIYDNMDVEEMDGFLTASAINPLKLNISQLTPYIFDITGNRESLSRADDRILHLIHRRYIEIKENLENKTDLEPIIFHHVDENDQPLKGEDSLVAAFGWAHGFMFGFYQWPREIQEFPATQISFIPIFSCLAMYEHANDLYSEELLNESRLAREMLPPINDLNDIIEYIMRATHLLYKATYQAYSENEALIRRKADRIGRNDPCPCGSGKKYKNCCGKRC